jgi:NAD+ synthase
MTLYSFANSLNFLVAGTGNKVEDYGIGFFTKYGDGGVDISPIADLLKSEVYAMAEHLKISQVIVDAPPTDGLWGDNRTDEDQIGATYEELEWALNFHDSGKPEDNLSSRQKTVLDIYKHRHYINKHKLEVPPVCVLKS